ncbi:PapD-like protein [Pseudocohnilembus persalinus]|uniref:PapD-like protein n=1 Tax=Pseudocohnilembus persalinus TaxID=266149 RepID=A0A0V0Q9Q6_PSEPJ|nr:PapD-like protein [Pseudocohnilembus persalinus]|eukprot:KRW98890.1 PapD-like protein [Pseudocohnilembus persalinus]
MEFDQSKIIKSQHSKKSLECLELESGYDIIFRKDQKKKYKAQLKITNISRETVIFKLSFNNKSAYYINDEKKREQTVQFDQNGVYGMIPSQKQLELIILIKQKEQVNQKLDIFIIQAIKCNSSNLQLQKPSEIWKNTQLLLDKQIEQRIASVQIQDPEIISNQNQTSIQKQKFLSEIFQSGHQQAKNTFDTYIDGKNIIQSLQNNSNQNYHYNNHTNNDQNNKQLENNYQNQNQNQNSNELQSHILTSQVQSVNRFDTNQSSQQIHFSQINTKDQNFKLEDVKYLYEKLLIEVDNQEKQLSQLRQQKEKFQQQIDDNIYEQEDLRLKNPQYKKPQGLKVWILLLLMIFFFMLGKYQGHLIIPDKIKLDL